jgi:bifunctional DNA-binding transcriptional regulator/antitoxin component of YhaV-PrlF toxin-antitoxin module
MKERARATGKGQITVPHEVQRTKGVRPDDIVVVERKGSEPHVSPERAVSPFEKFRGIGNPGIPTGRKRIIRYFRKLRGH